MSHPTTEPLQAVSSAAPQEIKVRPANEADAEWIEHLQALAFGPGRFARAAFRVREQFPIDPSLSLIAEIGDARVSSVLMAPISLSGVDGYLLGPLATDPAFRNRGAGKRLVREVCAMALKRGEGCFVLLVGDAPYYGPMGFVPTRPGAVKFPAPVDPARVLVHAVDPSLAETLHGPIAAFGAGLSEVDDEWPDITDKSSE